MKIFNTLMPGTVALSPQSDCGKPSVSGFNFMKEIQLRSNKHPDKIALVDDEDFEYLNQFKWYTVKPGNVFYAVAWVDGKMKKMHRIILKLTDSKIFVDHKDGNGLNNQKSNIRPATYSQNMANRRSQKNSSSKYLGVYWAKNNRKWKAQVRDKGELLFLGYFTNEVDAALAYNEAAIKAHGDFARLNVIT